MNLCRRVAFGFALLATSASGAEWNQFRGPRGNSVVDEAKLPSQWAENSNVAWKVKIPGRGWSQPVVAGDKVFVTTAICDNEEKPRRGDVGITPGARDARQDIYQWKVFCLSASTGKVLWEQPAYEGKPAMPKHRGNSYASETPVTDGERVIAYFGMKGITCYDLDGMHQWSKSLGEYPTQAGWGTGSSPVIYGDAVVIQCDNNQSSFLVALDKRTGDELWRVARDEKSNWSTPYIWKNKLRTELVVAGGKKMRSYEPATGKVLWEMAGSGRTSVSPVGDDELLYFDSVATFQGSPGRLAAIRAGADGDISLPDERTTSSDFVAWSNMLNSYRNASPLLYGDCLYMLEQSQGIVRCFDAQTGKQHYQRRIPESTGFTASPWANDGKVFLLDDSGLTAVIEPGRQFKVLASNRLNEDIFWSSVAVSGDRLLLRGMQHLYCVRTDDTPKVDAESVCRKSQSLAGEERYRFLRDWVLPHENGAPYHLETFRIPDHAAEADAAGGQRLLRTVRLAHGTRIASPVFELIDAAKGQECFEELLAAVDAAPVGTDFERRHQLALQILIAVADNNEPLAKARLKDQFALITSSDPAELQTRIPEQTTIIGLLDQPKWLGSIKNLALLMFLDKRPANTRQPVAQVERPLIDTVDQRIAELPARSSNRQPVAETNLNQWHAAPVITAKSVANGQHSCVWMKRRGFVECLAGETAQQLFYQSPLTGDFEITGEISTFPWREGTVAYGMFGVSPVVDVASINTIEPLRGIVRKEKLLPLPRWDHFADFRVVVKDHRLVNYINGVEVHTAELKPVPDPWVALHPSYPWFSTTVRNLRILGKPGIPEEVHLSQVTDLVNWRADYYGDRVGSAEDDSVTWFQNGDEILSRTARNSRNHSSLLIHQRPLSQDSQLSYEFFYQPGEFEVHPAMGETVWMLSPEGIRRRDLAREASQPSDGSIATTESQPPAGGPLSLKENDWNQVRLSLRGSTVMVAVNGIKIDEQTLDAGNTRQFGLFRGSGQVRCHVRNVRLRGGWPKTLPPVKDQELAMPAEGFTTRDNWPFDIAIQLDKPVAILRKLGLSFNVPDPFYKATPEGLEIRSDPKRTAGGVTEVQWGHKLRGDFDITISLADIELQPVDPIDLSLHIELDDPTTSGVSFVIGEHRQGHPQIMGDHRRKHPDNTSRLIRWEKHIPFSGGRLRMIREGGKAYLMYAQDEDEAYQLLCTYSAGTADVRRVMLWGQIHGPKGSLKAVVRELIIRADEIVD